MTICIAAIANNSEIFAVADRMITSGDIEFEPNIDGNKNIKIQEIVRGRVVVLTAGSSSIHGQILGLLYQRLLSRHTINPPDSLTVLDVAMEYSEIYDEIRRKNISSSILSPLGLTHDSFIGKQAGMERDFIQRIQFEMQNFQMPTTTAIMMGIDRLGPHIYVLDNSTNSASMQCHCRDAVGFAAIGSGSRHAETIFMSAKHTRHSDDLETGYLIYRAKKQAEIAPGVGGGTDMCLLYADPQTLFWMPVGVLTQFDQLYKQRIKMSDSLSAQEHKALQTTKKKIISARSKNDNPSTGQPPPSSQSPSSAPPTSKQP